MKITFDWLRDHLKTNLKEKDLLEQLTHIGLEVESVENLSTENQLFKIAKIIKTEKHPNADRLKLTEVNVGLNNNLSIICGAPNVAVGQKVIVAPVGSKLITIKNESFKIKKSKIRGIESEGMICAEDEIGVGTDHDGIIVLKSKYKVGDSADKVYKNFEDFQYLKEGLLK